MNWSESIKAAIDYIEDNLTNDITINDISKKCYISPYYFQKGFAMLCGYSVSEYIRNRRLSLAGLELLNTDNKIIDIALKYGYDSPDSFTKAFKRFHGTTPIDIRNKKGTIKDFSPLKINISLDGGYILDYRIEDKETFSIIGLKNSIDYKKAKTEVEKSWKTFFIKNMLGKLKPKYEVNVDKNMRGDYFDYIIGDDYNPNNKYSKNYEVINIPKFTWAIFPCVGKASESIKDINEKIFKEWLANNNNYSIADGYNIVMYSNPKEYKNGINDEKYYCEIWIPVIKK